MFGFLAQLLAWCYDVVPNYAVMILLFTLIVMAAVTPFTIKGMRSAAEMSRLQPEMKKLQDQHKNDKVKQNEEMQALFKEHGVNPLGGCLPTLLPLPIFFIIFRLLERLTGRHNGVFAPLVRTLRQQHGGGAGFVSPHYLAYKASLTQHIIASNGQMKAFGMDLAKAAQSNHASQAAAIPFYALIVIMTASQYWQQRQINLRNPQATAANPQMKMMMQIFPAFYALISLRIPATVVIYLLVSGLFRMAQNSISYRFDPVLARAAVPPGGNAAIEATSRPTAGSGETRGLGAGGGRGPSRGPSGRPGGAGPARDGGGRNGASAGRGAASPGRKGAAGNGGGRNGAAKNGAGLNSAGLNGAGRNGGRAGRGDGGPADGATGAGQPADVPISRPKGGLVASLRQAAQHAKAQQAKDQQGDPATSAAAGGALPHGARPAGATRFGGAKPDGGATPGSGGASGDGGRPDAGMPSDGAVGMASTGGWDGRVDGASGGEDGGHDRRDRTAMPMPDGVGSGSPSDGSSVRVPEPGAPRSPLSVRRPSGRVTPPGTRGGPKRPGKGR